MFSKSAEIGNRHWGVAAMVVLVLLWSLNFVTTRYSVLGGLTSFDMVALRFGVAGIVCLPYFLRLGLGDLGGLGWQRGLILTCLAGSPYIIVLYSALAFAPASHGVVLNPGLVPSVVFLGTVYLGQRRFSLVALLSLALILMGLALVTSSSFLAQRSVLLGDALFLVSGISWGLFTLLSRRWSVGPMQAVAVISVISSLWLVPYSIFFYDGFPLVSSLHLLSQALFQGILISIVTINLLIYAVRGLGAQNASLFGPLVPLVATLMAMPLLGELPTLLQWSGIALVCLGILGVARAP